MPLWWPLSFMLSHAQTPTSDKKKRSRIWDFFHFMVPWFSCLRNVTCTHFHCVVYKVTLPHTCTHMHTLSYTCTHMHTHTLPHKGSFNDVLAHLHQFHLEVEQGRGAIPIDLETPTSLRKRYKTNHRGAYVHQAGGGSTLSDVEVRIIVVVDTPLENVVK